MALEQIRTIEDLIKVIIPRFPYEAEVISVRSKGWHKISFVAPFKSKPAVVAVLEGELEGWITPPVFPKFRIPAITLPLIVINVPYFHLYIPTADDFVNLIRQFFGDWSVFNWMRDAIAWAIGHYEYALWNIFFRPRWADELNEKVLTPLNTSLQDTVAKLYQFRDSIQEAINNLTSATNSAIADAEKATEEAIKKLWDMLGQEKGRIFLPAKIRNVTSTGFEVYAPGVCTLHYIAFEVKIV